MASASFYKSMSGTELLEAFQMLSTSIDDLESSITFYDAKDTKSDEVTINLAKWKKSLTRAEGNFALVQAEMNNRKKSTVQSSSNSNSATLQAPTARTNNMINYINSEVSKFNPATGTVIILESIILF